MSHNYKKIINPVNVFFFFFFFFFFFYRREDAALNVYRMNKVCVCVCVTWCVAEVDLQCCRVRVL